jgi:hypothetical protein
MIADVRLEAVGSASAVSLSSTSSGLCSHSTSLAGQLIVRDGPIRERRVYMVSVVVGRGRRRRVEVVNWRPSESRRSLGVMRLPSHTFPTIPAAGQRRGATVQTASQSVEAVEPQEDVLSEVVPHRPAA